MVEHLLEHGHSGGNLNAARNFCGGAGTQTAALVLVEETAQATVVEKQKI